MGDWKLHIDDVSGVKRLYNLVTDIGETIDLSGTHPEIMAQLLARFYAWEARTLPPLYREGAMQLDNGLIRYPISGGVRLKNRATETRWTSGDLRNPVTTHADFHFNAFLRATETAHSSGAQLWYGLGDASTRAALIRYGIDYEAGLLQIVEGKTGSAASISITLIPNAFVEIRADYNASTRVLTVTVGADTVSLELTGNYGPIDTFAMGAAAMEGELTVPIALAQACVLGNAARTDVSIDAAAQLQLRLQLPADTPTNPVLQHAPDLHSFEDDPDGLTESMGGGLYRSVRPPKEDSDSTFLRYRFH